MDNTWPNGERHAMLQSEHAEWNASNFPGTRQMCVRCGEATGKTEDTSLWSDEGNGPFCEECYDRMLDWDDIEYGPKGSDS